jgi:hypothetical protein
MTITKKKFQWGNKPTPKTVLDLYDRYLPQIEEGNVIVAVEHHLSEKEYAEFESKYVPCVIERRGDEETSSQDDESRRHLPRHFLLLHPDQLDPFRFTTFSKEN